MRLFGKSGQHPWLVTRGHNNGEKAVPESLTTRTGMLMFLGLYISHPSTLDHPSIPFSHSLTNMRIRKRSWIISAFDPSPPFNTNGNLIVISTRHSWLPTVIVHPFVPYLFLEDIQRLWNILPHRTVRKSTCKCVTNVLPHAASICLPILLALLPLSSALLSSFFFSASSPVSQESFSSFPSSLSGAFRRQTYL